MSLALVNGREQDSLPLADRALAYGDGVFETVAVEKGRLCLWRLHCERLSKACQSLCIPFDRYEMLEREARNLAARIGNGVLKIIISAGAGERGYRRPPAMEPVRIVIADAGAADHSRFFHQGIDATVCQTRLARHKPLGGIKHLNRLEQVMARAEWDDQYQEGVMLDADGYVREGTMSNLFAVKDGRLVTPSLEDCGVRGVMREWIIARSGDAGIAVEEGDMTLDDLLQSDGFFFCNAVIRAWPVRTLNARSCSIAAVRELLARLPFADIAGADT